MYICRFVFNSLDLIFLSLFLFSGCILTLVTRVTSCHHLTSLPAPSPEPHLLTSQCACATLSLLLPRMRQHSASTSVSWRHHRAITPRHESPLKTTDWRWRRRMTSLPRRGRYICQQVLWAVHVKMTTYSDRCARQVLVASILIWRECGEQQFEKNIQSHF